MEKIGLYEKIPFMIAVIIVLFFIIKDSLKTYGKNKTIAFFISGIIYSIIRANFIGFIMQLRHNIEPILPYEINMPVIKIFGTTPVEISGWLIVSYLGFRISSFLLKDSNIFYQIILSALFISSVSFAVETTAIEADWWRWRVILGNSLFGKVPTMGILDWAFVSFEFLFPFILFTNKFPVFLRFISILIFPLHMFFHLKLEIISNSFPFTLNILFHILILFFILILAFFYKTKILISENKFPNFPAISILIIILTLFFYNLHFKVKIEYFLSLIPLTIFLFLNNKYIKYGLIIIFFPLSFISKMAIPVLILVFSYYFLKFGRKVYFLFLPLIILISISYFEGKKTIKINNAIERFNEEYKKGNWDSAFKKLNESLKMEERHPVGNLMMAEYYLKKENNFEKAEYYYKKSMEFYPYFKDSFLGLIQLYLDRGKTDEAFNLWKKGIIFNREDPASNYFGYKIYSIRGDKDKADEFLKKTFELTSLENNGRLYLYTLISLKGEKEAERVAWECLKEKNYINECLMFLWEFYSSKNDNEKLMELKNFIENQK